MNMLQQAYECRTTPNNEVYMGNASTEKRRLRRKKARQRAESQKKETLRILCISCGNQERTIDYTGRCDSCRRELYESECWMCDFD